jgi:conjugal transfer mating pair stabilization protein TraN
MRGIAAAAWLAAGAATAGVTCGPVAWSCVEEVPGGTVGGVPVAAYCAAWEGFRTCIDDNPANECVAVGQSPRCEEISSECAVWNHGLCEQTRKEFECLNENGDMAPAVIFRTGFGDVEETIDDQCAALDADPACRYEDTRVIEGEETRTINRMDFFRSWWRRARDYVCHGGGAFVDDCGEVEDDASCTLMGEDCIVEVEGNCTEYDRHYICGGGDGSFETECTPINICVGDTCTGIEQETSEDFGLASSWLNVLNEMVADFRAQGTDDPSEVRFFVGAQEECDHQPGRNCCDLDGVLEGIIPCSARQRDLALKRQAGATHFVGRRCDRKVFGQCIKRVYTYCTYNSRFSRVFQEQARLQTGWSWGSSGNASCRHVTLSDMYNLDLQAMDFGEVFDEALAEAQVPVQQDIVDFLDSRLPDPGDFVVPGME